MTTGELVAAGILLGLVAGSFLNVVAHRVPRDMSIVSPRSACPACETTIRARDNIPVVSWLLLRGRCRDCGAAISVRYPLVETGTAALFALLAVVIGSQWVLPAYWWFGAIVVGLSLIDLDVRRIPNRVLYPGTVVGVALLAAGSVADGALDALWRGLAGGGVAFAVFLVIALAARGGFGFGDVKLSFLLGVFLGYRSWGTLVVGLFGGFLVGGVVAIALLLARRVSRRDAVPFGPSMVTGALVALVVGESLADWYLG
jgi:leader peptidase (prepilin peptidase)/N-methyltransferase